MRWWCKLIKYLLFIHWLYFNGRWYNLVASIHHYSTNTVNLGSQVTFILRFRNILIWALLDKIFWFFFGAIVLSGRLLYFLLIVFLIIFLRIAFLLIFLLTFFLNFFIFILLLWLRRWLQLLLPDWLAWHLLVLNTLYSFSTWTL